MTEQPPKFWGRKCKILVTLTDGTVVNTDGSTTSSAIDVSPLKVVGFVEDNIQSSNNPCEITIYNLNRNTEMLLLTKASRVSIELGYENKELYGVVFNGVVTSTSRTKVNVTDSTLTIKALGDYDILACGVVATAIRRGSNFREVLEQVAVSSTPSLKVGDVPEDWGKDKKLSKGMSLAGKTRDIVSGIAKSTNCMLRISGGQINVVSLQEKPTKAYELNYKTGLVGQPIQTNEGINFQCLINPNLKLNTWVHISNALIQETVTDFGQVPYPSLDVDGLYRIIGRRFEFDTRGNAWYIHCKAVSQTGGLPDFLKDGATQGI